MNDIGIEIILSTDSKPDAGSYPSIPINHNDFSMLCMNQVILVNTGKRDMPLVFSEKHIFFSRDIEKSDGYDHIYTKVGIERDKYIGRSRKNNQLPL